MNLPNPELFKVNRNPDLIDDHHYELISNVIQLAGLFEHIATKEVSNKLSFSQIKILSMIESGICTRSSEFASLFNVSKANMTGMIGRLEKSGYLTREESFSDSRVKLLKLTDQGREYIDSSRPKFFNIINQTMKALETDDVRRVNDCLTRCIDGLNHKNSNRDQE